MTEDEFWAIVADTARQSPDDIEEQSDLLRDILSERSIDDLVSFDRLLTSRNHSLYRWDVIAAGDLMIGWMSDDVFTDFRTWIVSRGKATYDAVVADPDRALASLELGDEEQVGGAQAFAYVAAELYAERTGSDLYDDFTDQPIAEAPNGEPDGVPLDRTVRSAAQRMPRIAARYRRC